MCKTLGSIHSTAGRVGEHKKRGRKQQTESNEILGMKERVNTKLAKKMAQGSLCAFSKRLELYPVGDGQTVTCQQEKDIS
jgi:hypothetical protein